MWFCAVAAMAAGQQDGPTRNEIVRGVEPIVLALLRGGSSETV